MTAVPGEAVLVPRSGGRVADQMGVGRCLALARCCNVGAKCEQVVDGGSARNGCCRHNGKRAVQEAASASRNKEPAATRGLGSVRCPRSDTVVGLCSDLARHSEDLTP